jgi:hypothetical protein
MIVQGTLRAGNPLRDPEEQFAELRQRIVDGLHLCIKDANHTLQFPDIMERAIVNKVWMHNRRVGSMIVPPMKLDEFVAAPYPRGLETTRDVIEKLIAGNAKVMLAWDQAIRGDHGGSHNPNRDPETGRLTAPTLNVDNIHVEDNGTVRPTGTSAEAGLRRLDKAAQGGDEKAAALLHRVVDPNDDMTVNGACIEMGWRKPTKTVVDTDDGMADAIVQRLGSIDTIRQAWKRASQEQREEIAAWFDEQMGAAGALTPEQISDRAAVAAEPIWPVPPECERSQIPQFLGWTRYEWSTAPRELIEHVGLVDAWEGWNAEEADMQDQLRRNYAAQKQRVQEIIAECGDHIRDAYCQRGTDALIRDYEAGLLKPQNAGRKRKRGT